jgi:hypothetical protein
VIALFSSSDIPRGSYRLERTHSCTLADLSLLIGRKGSFATGRACPNGRLNSRRACSRQVKLCYSFFHHPGIYVRPAEFFAGAGRGTF